MINGLNRELLFQRMAGGALRGAAEEEMAPMRRCTGKLENGRQCSTVPLPGEEMCSGCKKRGAALYVKTASAAKPFRAHDLELGKVGKPAKRGAVSEAQAELAAATAPPILCRSCAGDGACDMSELGQTVCSAYCPEVAVPSEALEQAAQVGTHPADLPITLVDIEAAADEFTEAIIQREVATPPSLPLQYQVAPCAALSAAIAALVIIPVPPLPATAVVLEFESGMYDQLAEIGVGTATIIELLHLLFISKEYSLVRHAA